MHEYEWVFGTSKAAVVRTVMRWGRSTISCEFYDWAKHDPQMHESFFLDRESYRAYKIDKNQWSKKDESEYLSNCASRSRDNYRGWWRFCDLPHGYTPDDWFSVGRDHEELTDPDMPFEEVATKLQEQTYDEWKHLDFWEIESHDSSSIDKAIRYWRNEQVEGEDYYGAENEMPVA
ncbi:hypothetical protein [Pseudomonas chlororaphis]|uniref:hypothetical protein n=1 Tax=Pseudomonas chlororaphis TaxID=587753 RepID=UPI0023670E06|nr:hypothetical protein [Pseudomonas chlororaphis]WDH19916.1 hypothetical protein PUP50_17885 [Pseudomonas chlororaphis]